MKKRRFGRVDGRSVDQVALESAQAAVSVLSYGCIVRDWRVDGASGSLPVVLGFSRIEDYVRHSRSHGIIAGRVANRTAEGRFSLDGRDYQLTRNWRSHHLHGGAVGLGRRVWEMETAGDAVELRYLSPDGEEGYPGAVDFGITFRLEGPRLVCEMTGRPDRPTPINLAQHNYYNLGGGGTVLDHEVFVDAERYTPTGEDLIPTGAIEPVEGTRFDFREPRALGDRQPLDMNLVLREGRDPADPAASARCPRTGLKLRLWTEEPGLQIFNAHNSDVAVPGHEGQVYGPCSGLCLEPQHFPDSLNNPDWPSIIRTPETPYFQNLAVEIARG